MVLHYVKIQVRVLMKSFFYIRQRVQVVTALYSQPEGPEFESTPILLETANWSASCQLESLTFRLFGYSFHHCQG